jgi:hypothetical protein
MDTNTSPRPTCSDCLYFDAKSSTCRKSPPQTHQGFFRVTPADWCGDYRRPLDEVVEKIVRTKPKAVK